MQVALIYGTLLGNTENVAESIIEELKPEYDVELVDVCTVEAADLCKWDLLICGIPTWDIGQLEYGWSDVYDDLDSVDLDLIVAMFGLGDQHSYTETYQDAMGILYRKLVERGARGNIGFTSTDGHTFEGSDALVDGRFCGLAIDEEQQPDLTESRVTNWVLQIKEELAGLQAESDVHSG